MLTEFYLMLCAMHLVVDASCSFRAAIDHTRRSLQSRRKGSKVDYR